MNNLLIGCTILFFLLACSQQSGKNKATDNGGVEEKKSVIKPPTIFSDTLKIDSKAAVFYYPDSIQLKAIKDGLDPSIFDAVMHEYEYQMRFAHTAVNDYRLNLRIEEAKTVKYLVFIKADKSTVVIDLDKKYDPYGLIVFDPRWEPAQLDMTNAESQIGFYFNR